MGMPRAVGEGVLAVPVVVTAGVMYVGEAMEEQQSPPRFARPKPVVEAESQPSPPTFRRSTAPDDGSLFGFLCPEEAQAAADAAADADAEAAYPAYEGALDSYGWGIPAAEEAEAEEAEAEARARARAEAEARARSESIAAQQKWTLAQEDGMLEADTVTNVATPVKVTWMVDAGAAC